MKTEVRKSKSPEIFSSKVKVQELLDSSYFKIPVENQPKSLESMQKSLILSKEHSSRVFDKHSRNLLRQRILVNVPLKAKVLRVRNLDESALLNDSSGGDNALSPVRLFDTSIQ